MKKRSVVLAAMLLSVSLAAGMLGGCGEKEPTVDPTPWDEQDNTTGETDNNNTEDQAVSGEETQTPDSEVSGDGNADITDIDNEPGEIPEITSNESIVDYSSVVVVGNSGYELYSYRTDTATTYADTINYVATELKGTCDVYDILIPLSSEVTFPDNLKSQINSSDQKDAMDSIFAMMNEDVKQVDIYNRLMSHRTEYVYFRTDHHWTALGAYYAYTEFCKAKGIEAEALDSYEKMEFEGFLGSFYNDTDHCAALGETPDTVVAYKPNCQATMHVTDANGSQFDWPIINDVSAYSKGTKYSTFIAADNPFTVIENADVTDGSSCIIVKESFGNAFVPFFVDHYQTVYVVDYRYWSGSITELAKEKQVNDVIFANNLSMIRNKYLVGQLQSKK